MTTLLAAAAEFLILDVLGNIPLPVRRFLGGCIGSIASLIPTRERTVAELQLKLCEIPSVPETIRGVFKSLGITACEALNLKPILNDRTQIRCENLHVMKDAFTRGKGGVALTAHTGNWDLHGAYFIREGVPLFTVGRESRNPIAQRILASLRNRYGIRTVWRSDSRGLREIAKALQSGQVMASLIDQDTVVSSINVPFFGMPAKTPSSLINLARRWDCSLLTTFIFREKDGTYTVYTDPIPDGIDEEAVLKIYHERLEALIRRYPDQWVWFHKRWRSATGRTLGTTEYCEYLRKKIDGTSHTNEP